MAEVNMQDLENMSPEELNKLQSMLQVAQMKQKLGEQYMIHKALNDTVENINMPSAYKWFLIDLKEKNVAEIIDSVMNNDSILKFPTLMALTAYLPCSEIQLRRGLIELFDSYVWHSDFGLIAGQLIPFDVDRILKRCSLHDPSQSGYAVEEFYQKLVGAVNNPSFEGGAKDWVKKCMDDMKYVSSIIYGEIITYRFVGAIKFMSNDKEIANLNDPKSHGRFVDKFQESGADMLYAKRIAVAFKGK